MLLPLLVLLSPLVASEVLDVCPPGRSCIGKCCPEGKMIHVSGCIENDQEIEVPEGTLVVHSRPKCMLYYLEPGNDDYTIDYNRSTIRLMDNHGVPYDSGQFCLDVNELNSTYPYVCFQEDEEQLLEEQALVVYSWGLFLSVPFLLATVVIYACFKRLKNLHGRCVLNHTSCMLLSYVFLGLLQNGYLQDDVPCVIVGYAIQFFFMATFFWLNVMCFDIYWAFSGLRNLTGSVKERERKKLILYSIYAWCTPLLILVVTVAVDLSPSIPPNSIFKPQVGVDKCFFKEKLATWIYFYLPMALIIISNIFLFGVTAYRIWSHRRETAVLKRADSRKHDSTNDKERFSLYLKLFIVMGINWVMELLSSIVGGPSYLWYIPDFTNTLQGVFIFLIFVWKKRVRRLVWAKICSCFGKKPISSSTRTPWSGASTKNTNSSDSTRTNNSVKMNPSTVASQTTLA